MKVKRDKFIIIFILILCFLCTGCNKKKAGIGKEKLLDFYCDLPSSSEIEKFAPNFHMIHGTVEKGSILIDEKGDYGLLVHTDDKKVDMVAVIYRRGKGDEKQARMILDAPVSLYTDYSPCSESEGLSEYYQLYFGKDLVVYNCFCMTRDWVKHMDSVYLENQYKNR